MTEQRLNYLTLKDELRYEPFTGDFFWLVSRGRIKRGDKAGSINGQGYVQIKLFGYNYAAHRLAWFYMVGSWPAGEIDHKNMDRADNRWRNLREATDGQNQGNRRVRKDSKTGVRGVRYYGGRYEALIRRNGKRERIGYFRTVEEASAAYEAAAKEYFGAFARGSK